MRDHPATVLPLRAPKRDGARSASSGGGRGPGVRSGAATAALEILLGDAATGTPHFFPPRELARLVRRLAMHPGRTLGRLRDLGGDLGRITAGRSTITPARGDRRFVDPAWESWMFRRLLQAYLALGGTVDGLVSDADLDWRTERTVRLAAANVVDALAPTNFPWSNPAVLKETIDRGGANLVAGIRNFARDMSRPPRLPATVDRTKFEIGGNLATTPGSVVLRTEVFELLEYAPQTELVRELPLLVVPPTINKYYILDIAPQRSLVEHLVRTGQHVFMISWRNPSQEQGHWDLDTYAGAVLQARRAAAEITGSAGVHLAGACSGGLVAAAAASHLQATGGGAGVASLSLFVCAIDYEGAGTVSALTSREIAAAAIAESARRGYVDGHALQGVFTWLRPNDLVWSYVVSNYLLGKEPPAFDILYWNQDSVRMAAGLHRDFLHLAIDNSMARPGRFTVLGTPLDLSRVSVDIYAMAGLNDHIVPWESAYRSIRLFGGRTRFVLSTSGHIQALVNPPGPASRSSFRVTRDVSVSPDSFVDGIGATPGSWWSDYSAWLSERSGSLHRARAHPGSLRFRALAKAPGSYVHAL
ncbi:MAG: alpha/beta fold hydrolase [Candidatus Dormiibacterota bacterium]